MSKEKTLDQRYEELRIAKLKLEVARKLDTGFFKPRSEMTIQQKANEDIYLKAIDKRDGVERQLRAYKLRKKNPAFKIRMLQANRMNKILKQHKSKNSIDLLGCTPQQARKHLENQFTDKMTWDNHGVYWEIDHIKPCASFKLENIEQQRLCFHYTNLQPLPAEENRRKSDKLNWVKEA